MVVAKTRNGEWGMGNGKLKNVKSRAVLSALEFSCCLKRHNGQWCNKVDLLFSCFFKRLPFES